MSLYKTKYILLSLMILSTISACSFNPMYGDNSNSKYVMDNIYIDEPVDRNHQIVRNELIKYFGNVENKNNPLQLIFETSINKKSLLLDSSGEAKRMQIEFEVNYSIFKVGEYKELAYSNTVNVFNTYTLSTSEYNNSRAEIKTYDLIAREIGSIIVNQISMNYLQLID